MAPTSRSSDLLTLPMPLGMLWLSKGFTSQSQAARLRTARISEALFALGGKTPAHWQPDRSRIAVAFAI
jgi:hypothetical protein